MKITMKDEDDLLACLLDVAEAELNSLNQIQSIKKTSYGDTNPVATPTPKINSKKLTDVNIFAQESNGKLTTVEETLSLLHQGDTDSSDDEGKRNPENSRYSEYGRGIKSLLSHTESAGGITSGAGSSYSSVSDKKSFQSNSWKSKASNAQVSVQTVKNKSIAPAKVPSNVYTDPIFGLSIVNPLISSQVLEERMAGRKSVPICQISKYLKSLKKDDDWVIAGVLCSKGVTKTSAKGNQFVIWTMSDLMGEIKTIAMFLFGSAFKQFWKTQPGSVIGILNPSILDKKEGSRDEATLSVDNAQKVMILGQSRDLGTCKSTKKNGEKCTAIVNKNKCEFCIYHIKQEYQKCSQRSDLQANFSGKGLIALRNKVLGKNEVFYAGKSYMAIPAKQSKKMMKKDQNRLQSLSGISTPNNHVAKRKNTVHKAAESFDIGRSRRLKDMETLKKLGIDTEKYGVVNDFKAGHSVEVSMDESKANALKVLARLNENKVKSSVEKKSLNNKEIENIQLQKSLDDIVQNDLLDLNMDLLDEKKKLNGSSSNVSLNKNSMKETPNIETENGVKTALTFSRALTMSVTPSFSGGGNFIDLNKPILPRQANKAKVNALKFIEKNGPLKKADPMNIRGTGLKRTLDDPGDNENAKKMKQIQENEFLSDRFKKMMEMQSKHTDLVEIRDHEEKEKYFRKLEVKEQMEEKMANTYKIECKAVRCLTCKYTSFSAADRCKVEKHRFRVFDAVKRFFKCGHCGNRIACLDVVPVHPCKNCGSGNWERTTMMKEKKITNTVSLSIRGGEQKFANSVVTDANINLLVPDED